MLVEILNEASDWAGTPLLAVKRLLAKRAAKKGLDISEEDIADAISHALGSWKIDKTIAELPDDAAAELGVTPGRPIWHLKLLTHDESAKLQRLSPLEQATIQLLREKDEPRIGAIPEEEGRRILAEKGFLVEGLSFGIPGLVRTFFCYDKSKLEPWFGLIEEYEKTEEYKKHMEEMSEKAAEKEWREMRLDDESEVTGPIYSRLEEISFQREVDIDRLLARKSKMDKGQWESKKEKIEKRNKREEKLWEKILNKIPGLSYEQLKELQLLFKKGLPSPSKVIEFIEKEANHSTKKAS
jgi:hypothetical protein